MAASTRTVKVKFDGDAKGLTAAAKAGEREVDKFGKSVNEKFRKSGGEASKSFGSSMKKWFTGEGGGLFKEIGKSGGTVFGSGLLGALKTPILGPALLATVAAAATAVMPAAGAIAGAGLVTGFGAGIAGLGLVFAAKSDVVKRTWSKTLDDMGSDMRLLSRPFESTLISMAGFAKRTFAGFKPELDASFKLLAPAITDFTDGAARDFEQLAPAIRPTSEAFAAVLRSLNPALRSALGDTSKGLQDLAASVKQNPNALADTVKGVGALTKVLLDGITTLNNINGAFERLTGGVSLVDGVMGALKHTVGVALGPFTLLEKAMGAVGLKADKMNHSVAISAETTKLWTQGLDKGQLAAMGVGTAAAGTAPKVESLTAKFDRQTAATDALIQSTFRLQNLALGLSGAQINLQSAVDGATSSIKTNGRNLDINSEKGRNNRSALNNVAQAANAQTQAMIESNKGLGAASRSAETSRASFVRIATQMGLSKREAKALAVQLIAIPTKKNTNVTVSGADGAKGKVDSLLRSVQMLPNYKTIQIRYTQTGVNLTTPSSVGRRASGGLTSPKRRYLYGERGPEIAEFGGTGIGGPKIFSAEQTRRELSQPAGGDTYVYVEIDGEQLQGRIVKTVRDTNRQLKRTVKAG